MSKVNQQDQLDQDEHKGTHDAKVEPHCVGKRKKNYVIVYSKAVNINSGELAH